MLSQSLDQAFFGTRQKLHMHTRLMQVMSSSPPCSAKEHAVQRGVCILGYTKFHIHPFNIAISMPLQRCVRASCLLWLVVILFRTSPSGFGRGKQPLSSELRERNGIAIRRSAEGLGGPDLSKEEKKLVTLISIAKEQRDWPTARSLFATYGGDATQVYSAAIHAALRCGEYQQGAKIYEACRRNCEIVNQPVFVGALRIFGKLKEASRVQQVWDDALKAVKLNDMLGSARIAAAADCGDVEMAAEVLDLMTASNVSIEVYHINSAMRACWGFGKNPHKAAKYFFDLLPTFQLSPTLVSFTSLIGSYKTAGLEEILQAYNDMKAQQIKPDTLFAEIYTFSVLQDDKGRNVEKNLPKKSTERLQAVRDALTDFKEEGIRLPRVCVGVDRELARLGF